eukprot:scaffold85347_cov18-Tisochrysis_lutea.AAC.1
MLCAAGPEWRETVYDEDKDVIEDPVDDGGRHKLWVAHTVKDRQWAYSTRIGAVFDLGRLVNYVADFVDYNVSGMQVVSCRDGMQRLCGVLAVQRQRSGNRKGQLRDGRLLVGGRAGVGWVACSGGGWAAVQNGWRGMSRKHAAKHAGAVVGPILVPLVLLASGTDHGGLS